MGHSADPTALCQPQDGKQVPTLPPHPHPQWLHSGLPVTLGKWTVGDILRPGMDPAPRACPSTPLLPDRMKSGGRKQADRAQGRGSSITLVLLCQPLAQAHRRAARVGMLCPVSRERFSVHFCPHKAARRQVTLGGSVTSPAQSRGACANPVPTWWAQGPGGHAYNMAHRAASPASQMPMAPLPHCSSMFPQPVCPPQGPGHCSGRHLPSTQAGRALVVPAI